MSKTIINFILLFIVLVLAQAIVFNNICLFNVAIPFVFIYLILKLPMSVNINVMLTIGFITGLTVDIFSDTQGMNALACTLLAFFRNGIFHLYAPREDDIALLQPSTRTMGVAAYLKYLFTMILIYCAMVFIIEAFAFFHPVTLLLRIVCSTALTFIIIYAIDSLNIRRREKKL